MKAIWVLILSIAIPGVHCLAGEGSPEEPVVRLEGRQTNLFPVVGTVYLISGPDLYKGAENPGPASAELNIAWHIANEFIFRTALHAKYQLPAGSSRLLKDGNALVSFDPKQGDKELTVLVHWRKRTVEIHKP